MLGSPRARHRDGGVLVRAWVTGQWLHPAGWKGQGGPVGLLWSQTPFVTPPPSRLKHLPKAPTSWCLMSGVRISTHELAGRLGDTHIQTITPFFSSNNYQFTTDHVSVLPHVLILITPIPIILKQIPDTYWKYLQVKLYLICKNQTCPLLNIPKVSSEKAMAPHSSTLAWKIPWTEEPGRLKSMGLLRVRHDWETSLSLFTFMHWKRKWQPTPVFLPGESRGQRSLVGCRLWGRTESDTTEAT